VIRALLLGAAFLATVQIAPAAPEGGPPDSAASAASRPPYEQRGDEVEARYQSYRERLAHFFKAFGAHLEPDAPDLAARLREAPPAPVPYGYGILPKLMPDPPRPHPLPGIVSVSYSWRRTEGFVDRDLAKLEKLETRFAQTTSAGGEDRRRAWSEMVEEYRTLAANQKLIASHIEYNRLWQGEIVRRRAHYDSQTELHDAVLERQSLLDALQAGDEALAPHLSARVDALSRRIHDEIHRTSPPEFLRIEHPSSHRWIVAVPIYTDIEDRSFVAGFQAIVERAWHVRDGEDEFSVRLEVRRVPIAQLYPDGARPAPGEHIDVGRHIGRFPPDGAVLTTGSTITYVLTRSIDVGPGDIVPNTLVHEFGHIMGFADGYFRGYRDRGAEGFEVLEVVIDRDDIMSEPGYGRVSRQHFERLLDAVRATRGGHAASEPGRRVQDRK
jgi:hypothetical protein